MSNNYDLDDLARLHALEHIVGTVALMCCTSLAIQERGKPSEYVQNLKDALESSLYDKADRPKEMRELTREHVRRLMDNVLQMSKHADLGFK